MNKKLYNKLGKEEINQTREKNGSASPIGSASPRSGNKRPSLAFRDSAIERIKKIDIAFGSKSYKQFKFDVSKGTSLKGLLLRVSRRTGRKDFYLSLWFHGKPTNYTIGTFPNIRCKDVEKICLELAETHQDEKGNWIKSPLITRRNSTKLVPKKDTTMPAGKTINEVIESYCGADEKEGHRGFLKDIKNGYKTSKSAKNIFRCLAGYNKRQSHVTFEDDENGWCVREFLPNLHLRTIAPKSWQDLFRKYPPRHGVLKDREYYNRRKKQTYVLPASKNKSIYDSDLGKSLIEDLKPGDVEAWCRDLSSMCVKKDYIKVFTSLWFWARKRGWLGTNPGACPITLETVYVKKEIKKEDPYKDVAISVPELNVFFEASEELSPQFPFKAELHEFAVLTGLRKTEAKKVKKSFINWDEMIIDIPKGISKTKYKDEVIIITPELEIILRNTLDMGNRPGLEFYKMKDFPWLFATRRWKQERYFDKKFRLSAKTRLGGDENYIPALRQRMREKLNDPNLLYSFKVLRKTYITLSRKQLHGRADKVKHLSRHKSEEILQSSYDKPQRAEVRDYANKTTSVLSFIKRRA
jgi:integrase|tara:strand:- start:97 stop:1839 length:1743 start_codon:yes stop_codon:yes gene_type:complete